MSGADPKRPDWSSPKLKAAARAAAGGGDRRRHVGAAGRHPAEAGRHPLHHRREERRGRRHLVREPAIPDCRVDNPSHLYSYSFEPNHEWPNHFSPQPVLLAYFQSVADKHGLRAAHPLRDAGRGGGVRRGGLDAGGCGSRTRPASTETLSAKAVISAVGQLNQPRCPTSPGVDDFKGPAFHSARWRHDVDLKGKRVAVIGTGASAFQFVPEVAEGGRAPDGVPAHAAVAGADARLPRAHHRGGERG